MNLRLGWAGSLDQWGPAGDKWHWDLSDGLVHGDLVLHRVPAEALVEPHTLGATEKQAQGNAVLAHLGHGSRDQPSTGTIPPVLPMDQHPAETHHLDLPSRRGRRSGWHPSGMGDQASRLGEPDMTTLLPPGNSQVIGLEGIHLSVQDQCVVIGTEVGEVDQFHGAENSRAPGLGCSMTDSVTVERDISAPPEIVWALVSDVTRMGDFSPENVGCEWMGDRDQPIVGARFRGTNRNGKKTWKTSCRVVRSEPSHLFAFEVKAAGFRVARWEYRLDPTGSGCRVAETWTDQRGKLVTWLGGPVSGVRDRAGHNRAGIETTLERVAAEAEGTHGSGGADRPSTP
jgi:uncharacterized protein YndB with AHSA1/START domain